MEATAIPMGWCENCNLAKSLNFGYNAAMSNTHRIREVVPLHQ